MQPEVIDLGGFDRALKGAGNLTWPEGEKLLIFELSGH